MVGSRISLPFLAQPGFGLQEPREKRLLRRFATYYFSKSFVLAGQPTGGTDYLSADDFAELRVNGVVAGSVGSITDIGQAGQAQTALTAFDVTPLLKPGSNVITVKGQNGPPTFSPFCGTTCTYAQNVAGVVFGGTLSYVTASALVDAVSPELVLVDCELARRARMLLPDADDTLALPRSTRSDPEATLTPPAMILPDAGDTLALPAKATSGKPRSFRSHSRTTEASSRRGQRAMPWNG